MSATNIANGQLGAALATLYTGVSDSFGRVDLNLNNTSASLTETVTIKLNVAAGTDRILRQIVLGPNESAELLGIPLMIADALKAITTDATTVDYILSSSNMTGLICRVYDANGNLKNSQASSSGNLAVGASLRLAFGSIAAAGSTTTDAGVATAGKTVHVTSAANGTKGVRIATADDVAGTLLVFANPVAAVLKIYPPTGGNINAIGADAAFSTTSGKGAILYCQSTGVWTAAGLG